MCTRMKKSQAFFKLFDDKYQICFKTQKVMDLLNKSYGEDVVLALDGYPELCRTLAESEEKLWKVNAEDPLCIGKNTGVKAVMDGRESFDDRVFVRLSGATL